MMEKQELIQRLEEQELEHLLELIEDAEKGDLTELEIVQSIGLAYDQTLNQALISALTELGVTIIYVSDDED